MLWGSGLDVKGWWHTKQTSERSDPLGGLNRGVWSSRGSGRVLRSTRVHMA